MSPRCASCCGSSSERQDPLSTRAAPGVAKGVASGAPTGAASIAHARSDRAMLTPEVLPALQRALSDASLDGWLLFDFQGTNPVAGGFLGLQGMVTRRIFVWIPREGIPHALGHAIEPGPWASWPASWTKSSYSSWQSLEDSVGGMVRGKRIAMEYSAGDAVPHLDSVPPGVLEAGRAAGGLGLHAH